MADVTLYHILPSLCSQKVRLVLAEKGVPYTGRVVDIGFAMENYEPWYVRLNPAAVIPTLVHGERVVTDSARIVRYADEAFDGPALMPEGDDERAEVERWIERVDRLDFRLLAYGSDRAPKRILARMMGLRIRRLQKHMRNHPDLADAYRAKIEDVERWRDGIVDPAEIAAARAEARAFADALEQALADGRAFVVGGAYTLADVMATVAVCRLQALHRECLGGHPAIDAWLSRMRARPSFAAAELMDRIGPRTFLKVLGPWLLPRVAAAAAALLVVGGLIVVLAKR